MVETDPNGSRRPASKDGDRNTAASMRFAKKWCARESEDAARRLWDSTAHSRERLPEASFVWVFGMNALSAREKCFCRKNGASRSEIVRRQSAQRLGPRRSSGRTAAGRRKGREPAANGRSAAASRKTTRENSGTPAVNVPALPEKPVWKRSAEHPPPSPGPRNRDGGPEAAGPLGSHPPTSGESSVSANQHRIHLGFQIEMRSVKCEV